MICKCINGAFKDGQVTHAMSTSTTPLRHRCWILNWMVIFLFSLEDTTAMFSRTNLKCVTSP